jgi:2-keto-4-pentenoate hydratase/2-oxohepta-3-ene-1,7-dioic acid hydratase in catechol pathway
MVELVAIIGRDVYEVAERDAWSLVAGLTVGQDISDRDVSMRPAAMPQTELGKSLPGFAPIGPVLVTHDEFENRDDLGITCSVSGMPRQESRTSHFIFTIPRVIAYVTSSVPLFAGDVLFTGTSSGMGFFHGGRLGSPLRRVNQIQPER